MIRALVGRIDRSDAFGRALDVLGSVVALLLLAPVLAAVSLGVRVTLGRPVLFRQTRAGRNGRPFTMLKFRTMEMRAATCCCTPDACRGIQMASGVAMPRFVAMLRRTGLDELPQLVNILRGEMSFVGPRPLLPRYLKRYTSEQLARHAVRPGITGWAQISGRTDLSWNDRLALDVWYVANRSRSLDARILKGTVRAAVRGEGFSQSGSDTGLEFIGTGVPPGICPATELALATVCPGGVAVALAPDQRPHTESAERASISGAR